MRVWLMRLLIALAVLVGVALVTVISTLMFGGVNGIGVCSRHV